jgi:hypothetical protein
MMHFRMVNHLGAFSSTRKRRDGHVPSVLMFSAWMTLCQTWGNNRCIWTHHFNGPDHWSSYPQHYSSCSKIFSIHGFELSSKTSTIFCKSHSPKAAVTHSIERLPMTASVNWQWKFQENSPKKRFPNIKRIQPTHSRRKCYVFGAVAAKTERTAQVGELRILFLILCYIHTTWWSGWKDLPVSRRRRRWNQIQQIINNKSSYKVSVGAHTLLISAHRDSRIVKPCNAARMDSLLGTTTAPAMMLWYHYYWIYDEAAMDVIGGSLRSRPSSTPESMVTFVVFALTISWSSSS